MGKKVNTLIDQLEQFDLKQLDLEQEVEETSTERIAHKVGIEFDKYLTNNQDKEKIRYQYRYKIHQVILLEKMRESLRKKRDEKNKLVRDLFEEAKIFRERRDEKNKEVAILKKQRNEKQKQLKNSEEENQIKFLRKKTLNIHRKIKKQAIISQQYHTHQVEKIKLARSERKLSNELHNQVMELTIEIKILRKQIKELKKKLY